MKGLLDPVLVQDETNFARTSFTCLGISDAILFAHVTSATRMLNWAFFLVSACRTVNMSVTDMFLTDADAVGVKGVK